MKNELINRVADALENAINTYQSSRIPKSKKLLLMDAIPDKVIDIHSKYYAHISEGERAMVLFGSFYTKGLGSYGVSGVVVSDRKLYYRTLKDSFWTGIMASKEHEGAIPLDQIKELRIGEHDHCYGTHYVGHQLIINGKVMGLVRMGNGLMLDEEMIDGINQIGKVFNNTEKFAEQNTNLDSESNLPKENTNSVTSQNTYQKSHKKKKTGLYITLGVILAAIIGFFAISLMTPAYKIYDEEIEDAVKYNMVVLNFLNEQLNGEFGYEFTTYVLNDESSWYYELSDKLEENGPESGKSYFESIVQVLDDYNTGERTIYTNTLLDLMSKYETIDVTIGDFKELEFDIAGDEKYSFIETNTGVEFIFEYNTSEYCDWECYPTDDAVDKYIVINE